jgi:membrane-bound lytic murein transglycosylase F
MKYVVINLVIVTLLFYSCSIPTERKTANVAIDSTSREVLERVLTSRKLRVATDYGYVSYLIYRNEPLGYQYELLDKFSKYLGVELEISIETSIEKSKDKLDNGKIDLIGLGMIVSQEAKKEFQFTDPILITRQVLVQRKPNFFEQINVFDDIDFNLFREPFNLKGKTIYIEKGSDFANKLRQMSSETNDSITILEEDKDQEELIRAVASSEIDYTIADKHIALVNSLYFPNLDVKTPVSFPQKIAWACKTGETGLTDTINYWLEKFNQTMAAKALYNKYFKNIRPEKIAQNKKSTANKKKISSYDVTIKEAALMIGWDWRLLASMIYQESQFDPNARAWTGAYGLMQMMPTTMTDLGIDENSSPEKQILAGAKYLGYIDRQFPDEIADSSERVKFVIAAYNSGYAHIFDARRLAAKYRKNPNVWEDNVDFFVLNLSDNFYYRDTVVRYGYFRGEETYKFVREIIERFEEYKKEVGK